MVRKSGKYGVRSGNTIRYSPNCVDVKRNSTQSCLIRNKIFENTLDELKWQERDAFADRNRVSDRVEYSLNKRQRWKIPEQLKTFVLEEREQDDEIKFTVLEKHKLKNHINCLSYTTSKGDVAMVVPKTSTYFEEYSVVSPHGKKYGRRARRREREADRIRWAQERAQEHGRHGRAGNHNMARFRHHQEQHEHVLGTDNEEQQKPKVEIRYEVYYPSPKTSSVTYNPKYAVAVPETGKPQDGRATRHRKMQRRRNLRLQANRDSVSSSDDEQSDNNSEVRPSTDIDNSENYFTDVTEDLLISELLCAANRAKELTQVKNMHRYSSSTSDEHKCEYYTVLDTKDHVFYIDRPGEHHDSEVGNVSELNTDFELIPEKHKTNECRNEHIEMYPVQILIPYHETIPEVLLSAYGTAYTECQCYPRKFTIDISKRLVSMVKSSKRLARQFTTNIDTWCWLSFVQDGHCPEGLQIYQVYLNADLDVNSVRIETLCDMTAYTLDEVVDRTLYFFDTLPCECFRMTELSNAVHSECKFDLLSRQYGWENMSYNVDATLKNDLDDCNACGSDLYQLAFQDVIVDMSEFCNICFESIDPLMDDSMSATSLKRCQHWFCNMCWREYLHNQLTSGHAREIQCPELDCEATVDWATAVTLVSVDLYRKYAKRCHSLRVQRRDTSKWCPNPSCGQVLELRGGDSADSGTMRPISCLCGQTVCFHCLGEPHWPASCDQAKQYRQKLEALNDVSMAPMPTESTVIVNYKKCPSCNEAIEKFHGCPHMRCVCGFNFCWSCMKGYPHEGVCAHHSDLAGTQEAELHHIDRRMIKSKTRSRAYVTAIRHRVARHPDELRRIRKKILALKKRMTIMDYKRLGEVFSLRQEEHATPSLVSQFFSDIVSFYLELQTIAEHTASISDVQGEFQFMFCRYEHQMQFICLRLVQILESSDSHTVSDIIALLNTLKSRAYTCIARLIPIVKNFTSQSRRD